MHRRLTCSIGLSILSIGFVACGDDEPEEPSGTGGETSTSATSSGSSTSSVATTGSGGSGGSAPSLEVSWAPCALDSNRTSGDDAECALVPVPLDWVGDPFGETIEVFVKRWPVLATPAPHHFWMIQGGPGSASLEFESKVANIGASFPDAQFYFRDPRGVGRSTRLSCPGAESDASEGGLEVTLEEWPACIDEVEATFGDRLDHFTTSQTARDLGGLIEATRGDATKLTLFGSSYGTTLVQRYLHFFPDQVDAVLLDSLANPGFKFTNFSLRIDAVGHEFLDLCGEDEACAARLGGDPSAFADEAFATQLDDHGCPELVDAGVDRASLAYQLAALMQLAPYRDVILPVIHRLARCAPGDIEALLQFDDVWGDDAPPTLDERLYGAFLYHHIVFSETWSADAPTPEAYLETLSETELGLLNADLETLAPTWPVYPIEPLADVYPEATLPILMANGTLDTQTPLADAMVAAEHYMRTTQHFLVVPGAPHGAFGGEAWNLPSAPCSVQIVEAFVNDPSEPIDTSCFASAGAVSLDPSAMNSTLFFGTSDPWGDAEDGARPAQAHDQPMPGGLALAAARAELRRELRRVMPRRVR